MTLKAQLTGDWEKARTILNNIPQVRAAIDWAVVQEAHEARRRIVRGITDQAPGGKQFQELAALTKILRRQKGFRGTKALIVSAALRNSITVKNVGRGRAFVGVLRGQESPDGKQLFNIARVHEVGATVVIKVTPRMRRFLMAMLRRAGLGARGQKGRDKTGRYTKRRWRPAGGAGGVAKGVVVVQIPARPFISPVIQDMLSNPAELQRRLAMRIAYRMRLTLGKP